MKQTLNNFLAFYIIFYTLIIKFYTNNYNYMKKNFIKLTILLCLIFANNLYAQDVRSNHSYKNLGFTKLPTISVGGYIDVNAAMPTQETPYSEEMLENVLSYDDTGAYSITNVKNRATDNVDFAGEASLIFTINGLNDYGFKYGAVMELNANSTHNSWNNDLNATRSFIYGEGLFGKFEIGNELGASQKMKIDASTFARAAGGINGKYLNYINLPSIASSTTSLGATPLFILIPELPTAHGGFGIGYNNLLYSCDSNGDGQINIGEELACYNDYSNDNFRYNFEEMQNATKISYYTPEIFGFQLGISYTPDTGNKGVSGQLSSKLDTGDIDDVLEAGITYNNSFAGLGIALSATGQIGKSESKILDANGKYQSFREDLQAYQLGANLSYYGLILGGSIGNWGTSLYNKDLDLEKGEGKYMTLGIAYEFAGLNTSVTYFNSEFQDNEYTAYSIGIDYKVAKGFLPYVEYTNFEFTDSTNITQNNKGSVVIAGVVINF